MKVTHFGVDGFPLATSGWSSGSISVNSNFNTEDGGLSALNFVQGITANGSNMLLRPIANFAAGSNILLTLDSGPGGSIPSNTIRIHSTASGGGGGSALTVQEVDGSPTDSAVTKLIFPNDSLTIAGHEVTIRDVPQAFIGAKAYNSGVQNVADNTLTALTYDSEEYDTDAFHSTSTNTSRMTIPAGMGGKYLLVANAYFSLTDADGQRQIGFRKNGSTRLRSDSRAPGSGTERYVLVTSTTADLVAGDYVEIVVVQNSGAAMDIGHASAPEVQSAFSIVKLDSGKVGGGIGARAVNSGTQSVADDATNFTAVAFGGTDEFDTDGFHDPASNNTRMTIPAGLGGKYLVTANWYLAVVNATGWRDWALRKNGTTIIAFKRIPAVNITNAVPSNDITTVVDLAAGDYVEAVARQNSGGSTTIAFDAGASAIFEIMRLDSGSNAPLASGSVKDTSGDHTISGTTFADVDTTNCGFSITTGARKLLVGWSGSVFPDGTRRVYLDIAVDGVRIANTTEGAFVSNTAANFFSASITLMTGVLSAGSHTVRLQARQSAGGGSGLVAGGSAGSPVGFLWATELSG